MTTSLSVSAVCRQRGCMGLPARHVRAAGLIPWHLGTGQNRDRLRHALAAGAAFRPGCALRADHGRIRQPLRSLK
jgi:hypothetical protein